MSAGWQLRNVDDDYAEIRMLPGDYSAVTTAGVARLVVEQHNAAVARPTLSQQEMEAAASRVLAGAVRELLWGLAPAFLRRRRADPS